VLGEVWGGGGGSSLSEQATSKAHDMQKLGLTNLLKREDKGRCIRGVPELTSAHACPRKRTPKRGGKSQNERKQQQRRGKIWMPAGNELEAQVAGGKSVRFLGEKKKKDKKGAQGGKKGGLPATGLETARREYARSRT